MLLAAPAIASETALITCAGVRIDESTYSDAAMICFSDGLAPHQPRNQRQDHAYYQHSCNWQHEPESRPIDNNVPGKMEQMHAPEPWPE
jgi:hypothetical protein